jgi:hypothetical protein
MSRIVVITAGHPSTCPRMVKAADAMSDAGHDVRIVCTRFIDWATDADRTLLTSRRWRTTTVDYAASSAPWRSRLVRARRRLAKAVSGLQGEGRRSWWAATRAYSYVHPEMVRAALAEPADLFYGGTTGALAVVEEASRRARRPFGVDLEDLHTAESVESDADSQHAWARAIEGRVLPAARVRTTSSEAIAEAYQTRYGLLPDVIHNVFPLPAHPPDVRRHGGPLRCYWFSQTVGPSRGLEEFIAAAGLLDVPMRLVIQGRAERPLVDALSAQAAHAAPHLAIDFKPPCAPGALAAEAAQHDIGLSLDLPIVENRDRCLTNKLFTYLIAGLAVIATTTRGQQALAGGLGDSTAWWTPPDRRSLAEILRRWQSDRDALVAARRAAWLAASSRWHWGHQAEGPRLVSLLEAALP